MFTAPTKPLVTQQVDACKKITGIGADMIAELTGSKSVETRRVSWVKKRLFFMTPEVRLLQDLDGLHLFSLY